MAADPIIQEFDARKSSLRPKTVAMGSYYANK